MDNHHPAGDYRSEIGPPFNIVFNGAVSEICEVCKARPAKLDIVSKGGYCIAWVCTRSCFTMWIFQKGVEVNV